MAFLLLGYPLSVRIRATAAEKAPVFDVITVSAAITPPIAEYIVQSIGEAAKSGAEGLIIRLDTPGGLDLAMRDIAKGILNAPMPVIVYVAPSGARAASAGVIITIAAHIAAMAPGTNIGAAHPVGIGIGGGMDKTMSEKVENDAVAYVRGIAKKRGRNEEWVEKAVRKSESIAAEEALRLKVIDFVAADMNQLLAQVDGREVSLVGGKKVLRTKGAVLNEKKMGTRQKILSALSDPNIAYILLLIGLAGLYFEFSTPGVILPGVIGGISLIMAFFAMQTLPVNYAGVALILFGIILFIAEIKVISHGILTIGGIVSLVIGSLMLFQAPDPALRVSWSVLIPAVTIISLFFVAVIAIAVKAQLRKTLGGKEGMAGEEGRAVTDVFEEGKVLIHGEYWDAVSDVPVAKGAKVRVIRVEQSEGQGRTHRIDKRRSVMFMLACIQSSLSLFWSSCFSRRPSGSSTSTNGPSSSAWGGSSPRKGPGLIILIPVVDKMVRIDMRTITMDVPPQDVITRDNVSIKVNAVVYFRVIDANAAVIDVENYLYATSQLSQTTLRSVCGQMELDEILSEREKINLQLQEILDRSTEPWGIKVSHVEVKQIDLPEEMKRAIAKQAEAERERRAKVINAEGEFQAAQKLIEAAALMETQPMSLQLRYLQTLNQIAAENNSTTLFPIPIDLFKPFLKLAEKCMRDDSPRKEVMPWRQDSARKRTS